MSTHTQTSAHFGILAIEYKCLRIVYDFIEPANFSECHSFLRQPSWSAIVVVIAMWYEIDLMCIQTIDTIFFTQ